MRVQPYLCWRLCGEATTALSVGRRTGGGRLFRFEEGIFNRETGQSFMITS